nr:hypothetical protein [Rhodococcus sp. 06-621-2]
MTPNATTEIIEALRYPDDAVCRGSVLVDRPHDLAHGSDLRTRVCERYGVHA